MRTHIVNFAAVLALCLIVQNINASDNFMYYPDLNLHHLKIPISKQRLTLDLVRKFIQKYSADQPHFRGFYEEYFDILISQVKVIAEDENSSWSQIEHAAAALSLIIRGHPTLEQSLTAHACRRQLAPLVERLLEKAIQERALIMRYMAPALFILTGSPEIFEKLDAAHRLSFFEEAARIIEAETTTWDEIEHVIMGLTFFLEGLEQLGIGDSEKRYFMKQQIRALTTTIAIKYRKLLKETMAEAIVYGNPIRALESGLCIYNLVSNAYNHIQDTRVEDERERGVERNLFAPVPALEKELYSIIGGYSRALGDRQCCIEMDYWNGIDRPQRRMAPLTKAVAATPEPQAIVIEPQPKESSIEVLTHVVSPTTPLTEAVKAREDTIVIPAAPGTVTVVTTFNNTDVSSVVIEKAKDSIEVKLSPKGPETSKRYRLNRRLLAAGALILVTAISASAYLKWGNSKKALKQTS